MSREMATLGSELVIALQKPLQIHALFWVKECV